jgi:hypothetical protein
LLFVAPGSPTFQRLSGLSPLFVRRAAEPLTSGC